MNLVELKEYCQLAQTERRQCSSNAMKQYNFSGRSLHRILKVSRTIADLAGSGKHHLPAPGRGD